MRYSRAFIFSALAALIFGVPVISRADVLKDKNRKPIMIGLQLYSVRDDCAKDLPGVLKAVAKMGYTGVEFAGYYGRSAQELRAMLDEDGLKCYGTHIGLETPLGDKLVKKVEFNKALGKNMRSVPLI